MAISQFCRCHSVNRREMSRERKANDRTTDAQNPVAQYGVEATLARRVGAEPRPLTNENPIAIYGSPTSTPSVPQ
jgi:hypothetical protein